MLDRIFKKKVLSVYTSLLSVLNFFLLPAETVSQYIIAVIVTYGVGWTVWSLNPGRGQTIFLFSKLPISSLGPAQSPIQWVPWLFPGVKQARA
jgi:hypothetical protein